MRFLAIGVLAALLPSLASAQMEPIAGFELFESTSPWPQGAAFRAMFVGRMATAWDSDVVVLCGGDLRLQLDPASRQRSELLATAVTDAVLVRGLGPGGLDAVLFTNASGAHLCTWNGAPSIVPVPALSSWANATMLRAGETAIYALSSSGNEIYRAPLAGGGSPPTGFGAFAASDTVRDIRSMDWGMDGNEDLAVLYVSELEVRSFSAWTGSPFFQYPAFGATDRIAVSQAPSYPDILAYAFDVAGLTYVAALYSGHTSEPVLNLGALAAGITCFEYGFDTGARQDLIVSDANSSDVYVFERQEHESAHSFWLHDGPIRFALGSGVAAPGTLAAGGDVDRDGDIDALFGLQSTDEVRIHLNDRFERYCFAPRLVNAIREGNDLSLEFVPYTTNTHLEVECRYQSDMQGPSHLLVQLGVLEPGWVEIWLGDAPAFRNVQFIVREVRLVGGSIVAKYPKKTFLYAPEPENYQSLLQLPEVAQYGEGSDPAGEPKLPSGFTLGGRGIGNNP